MKYVKIIDACKQLETYVKEKSWQTIGGENIIEDTMQEFDMAKDVLFVLVMKTISILQKANQSRCSDQFDHLYEKEDWSDDEAGVTDSVFSSMIGNAQRLCNSAEKIVAIRQEHINQQNVHFFINHFQEEIDDDVMSKEFVVAHCAWKCTSDH